MVLSLRPTSGSRTTKVDERLPGKGISNSHGARPVHLIITMIKWIRTSRFSINDSLSGSHRCRSMREQLEGLRHFCLNARTETWSRLSYVYRVFSTAAVHLTLTKGGVDPLAIADGVEMTETLDSRRGTPFNNIECPLGRARFSYNAFQAAVEQIWHL